MGAPETLRKGVFPDGSAIPKLLKLQLTIGIIALGLCVVSGISLAPLFKEKARLQREVTSLQDQLKSTKAQLAELQLKLHEIEQKLAAESASLTQTTKEAEGTRDRLAQLRIQEKQLNEQISKEQAITTKLAGEILNTSAPPSLTEAARTAIQQQYHQYKETLADICGQRPGPNEVRSPEEEKGYQLDCHGTAARGVRKQIDEMEIKFPWLKGQS